MSSLRVCAGLAALLFQAPVSGLQAQTPDELARLHRLEQRHDSLRARVVAAEHAAAIAHDTLRAGPLLIRTDSAGLAVLRSALADVTDLLARRLGPDGQAVLRDAVVVVRFGGRSAAWGQLVSGDAQFVQVAGAWRTEHRLRALLVHAVEMLLAARGGRAVAAWRADVRPLEDPEPLRDATHIELVTSRLSSAQACRTGSLLACRHALGLSGAEPLPAAVTDGLPDHVADRYQSYANTPALAPTYARCVAQRDGRACVAFLATIDRPLPTMSSRAKGTVLHTVIDVGGEGAAGRFFADSATPIGARVEAATGMPLDTVLAAWRTAILAQRPTEPVIPAGVQWLTLGWTVLLTGAATRSTRWR